MSRHEKEPSSLLNELIRKGKVNGILLFFLKYGEVVPIKLIFPGDDSANLRHDLRNVLSRIIRGSNNLDFLSREAETARIIIAGLLNKEIITKSVDFKYFVPKPYSTKVHYLDNYEIYDDWSVIEFRLQRNKRFDILANKNLSSLMHRFVGNLETNLIELFHREEAKNWKFRLNCNVFMLSGEREQEGFFIDNNGPLIDENIFEKLGKVDVTSKENNENHGIGLRGIAKSAKNLGYSFVCVQWNQSQLMINDLSNKRLLVSDIEEENLDPLYTLGKNVMTESLTTWKDSSVSHRKPPNVVFGIVGNRSSFFYN